MRRRPTRFDLELHAVRPDDGPGCAAAFTTTPTCSTRPPSARLAGTWTRLLRAVVADPDARRRELDLLAPAERGQVLHGWNDTAADFPAGDDPARPDRGAGGGRPRTRSP